MIEHILTYLEQAGAVISLSAVVVIVAGFALAVAGAASRGGEIASHGRPGESAPPKARLVP